MATPEEEVALLEDYVSDSVDHHGFPAGKISTGGWRSAWYIIGKFLFFFLNFLRVSFFSWKSFTSFVFFSLKKFRCGGRRKICLLWYCLQLNYLPHRTSRAIHGDRRRKRQHVVRNSLDASCLRSFHSRRISWSLSHHCCSFSHLHTRRFSLPLPIFSLILRNFDLSVGIF